MLRLALHLTTGSPPLIGWHRAITTQKEFEVHIDAHVLGDPSALPSREAVQKYGTEDQLERE